MGGERDGVGHDDRAGDVVGAGAGEDDFGAFAGPGAGGLVGGVDGVGERGIGDAGEGEREPVGDGVGRDGGGGAGVGGEGFGAEGVFEEVGEAVGVGIGIVGGVAEVVR